MCECENCLDDAIEVLEEFVDPDHHQRPNSRLCNWCGLRWPCPNEKARRIVDEVLGHTREET